MDIRSNSPLQNPPADYCPLGSEAWFEIPEGLDAGKQLFYYDYSTDTDPRPERTVLFVHGNPECSYTYRHIRDALIASGESLRIVAMDHIGMGLSDQADFEMVDMHHAANVALLVRHLNLQNVTLVIHDWGGPIGIGALINEPERVSALLVMNTTVFPMAADGYTYKNYPFPWLPWFLTASLIPNALWGGAAAAVVCHAHPQPTVGFLGNISKWLALHGRNAIPQDQPEYVFSQMFRSTANAVSSKRNVRQTPFWGHGYTYQDRRHGLQDNHAFYTNIQEHIESAWGASGRNIPACGFFGQWDACGKDSVIAQWHKALPNMANDTHTFPDIGHFIEEYKGPEMAASILKMHSLG